MDCEIYLLYSALKTPTRELNVVSMACTLLSANNPTMQHVAFYAKIALPVGDDATVHYRVNY